MYGCFAATALLIAVPMAIAGVLLFQDGQVMEGALCVGLAVLVAFMVFVPPSIVKPRGPQMPVDWWARGSQRGKTSNALVMFWGMLAFIALLILGVIPTP